MLDTQQQCSAAHSIYGIFHIRNQIHLIVRAMPNDIQLQHSITHNKFHVATIAMARKHIIPLFVVYWMREVRLFIEGEGGG